MRKTFDFHREFAYPIVFGALWGAWELSLGSLLHLSHFPFKGVLLASGAVVIALVGKSFARERWSILKMGVIAAFLRILAPGGVILSPMIAIVVEALILESVIMALSKNPLSYSIAGAITFIWPPIHRLIFQGLIFGKEIYMLYVNLIDKGIRALGVNLTPPLLVTSFLIFLMAIGFLVGLLAWTIGENTRRRLGWSEGIPG